VQVLNPTLSASGAFSLNGGSITAGAFDYFLFKGGVTQGSQGNWYLRNELIAPPLVPPGTPVAPGTPVIPVPTPAPGTPPLPTVVPGEAPIPLFDPVLGIT